jgi:hypothetical protein
MRSTCGSKWRCYSTGLWHDAPPRDTCSDTARCRDNESRRWHIRCVVKRETNASLTTPKEDIKKIRRDWGVSVQSAVDLSGFARELDPYWAEEDERKAEARREAQRLLAEERAKAGIPPPPPRIFKKKTSNTPTSDESTQDPQQPKAALVGLARLAARYLSLELVKNKKTSKSNWELPLTQSQLECKLFNCL